MEFGLSLKQKEGLISIFDKHLKQGKVIVYGSRAKGNFTAQSDMDLVIQSSNATDRHLLATIHADIMESDFPYLCDIQYLEEIKSPRLLNHIKRMGKTFYQKESGKMAGWEQVKIEDIVHPLTTVDPRKSPRTPFKYIDVSSVSRSTHTVQGATTLFGSEAPSRARRKVQSGDILFATIRPTLQRIAVIPEYLDGAICSTGYYVLRPRDQALSSYLFYYLFSQNFTDEMESLQRGASYPAVSDRDVKEHAIILPPIAEQKRIVAILDEAFAAIATATANTKKNLANARELFASQLEQAFTGDVVNAGWEQTTLGTVCEVIAGQSPKGSNYNDSGDGLPFYQGKKEFGGKRIGAPTKWTTQVTREAVAGDILMSVRAPVGPINFATERICIGRGLASIRAKEQIHRAFLFYLLLSMQEQIKGNEGAVFASINKKQIENIKFVKPSLTEQKKITARLDKLSEKIQSLIGIYQTKLTALAELKQSLLHKAFTGELTADSKAADRTFSDAGV